MSFLIAAPGSGSGKTTITLGLLRALTQRGIAVRGAKSGPDYIDPRFHAAACGRECFNLDAWAMSPKRIASLAAGDVPLIIEGAMGLFDGAPPTGKGACADLARQLGLPVVLVVDASHMAQSVAALVGGFLRHDPALRFAGVLLNKVGSARHEAMLKDALEPLGVPVLGTFFRQNDLSRPSRHLGLVQAGEHPDLSAFLDQVADQIETSVDMDAISALLQPVSSIGRAARLQPPAQRIAVAQDNAFAFAYPHILQDWSDAGAEIDVFSPLRNDPVPWADLVFLPGGYPELYAGRLAGNQIFLDSLRAHAESKPIYGECGGYMVLGDALTDAKGETHQMAGLLRLETSFEIRKLHLGYRTLRSATGPFEGDWTGHEFHYATTQKADGTPLFAATDATGSSLSPMGLVAGHVSGSFAHVIDKA